MKLSMKHRDNWGRTLKLIDIHASPRSPNIWLLFIVFLRHDWVTLYFDFEHFSSLLAFLILHQCGSDLVTFMHKIILIICELSHVLYYISIKQIETKQNTEMLQTIQIKRDPRSSKILLHMTRNADAEIWNFFILIYCFGTFKNWNLPDYWCKCCSCRM